MGEIGGGPLIEEEEYARLIRSKFLERVNPHILVDHLLSIDCNTCENISSTENVQKANRELFRQLIRRHNWFRDLLAALRHQQVRQDDVALEFEIIHDEVLPIFIKEYVSPEQEAMEVDEPDRELEQEVVDYAETVRKARALEDIEFVGTRIGSLILLVRVKSLRAIDKLRKMYMGGALQDILQKEMLASKVFAEFKKAAEEGGHDINTLNFSIRVKEEDLERCERAQRKKAGVPNPSNFLEAAVIGRGQSEESQGTIARNFNQLPHKVKSALDFVSRAQPDLGQQGHLLDTVAAHLAEGDFQTAQANVVKTCCSQIDVNFPTVQNCYDQVEFLSLNTVSITGSKRECPIELYESPDGEIWFAIHHLRLSGRKYKDSSVVVTEDKVRGLKKRTGPRGSLADETKSLSEEDQFTRHLSFFKLPLCSSMAQLHSLGLFHPDCLENGVLKFSEPAMEDLFLMQALLRGTENELAHFHKAELLWDYLSLHVLETEVKSVWEKYKDSAFMDQSVTKRGIFSALFLAVFRRLCQVDLPLAKSIPPIVIFKGDKREELCKFLKSLIDDSAVIRLRKEYLIDNREAFAAVLQLLQMKAVLPEGGKLHISDVCEPVGGGTQLSSRHQYLIYLTCVMTAVSESFGGREMTKQLLLETAPANPECFDLLCEALSTMHCIREVNLTNSRMSRAQVRAVIKAVQPQCLTSLSLAGCKLQVEHAQGSSAGTSPPPLLELERLYHLEALDVKDTGLGDEGIKALAAEIKNLGQLRELDLGKCGMTSKGLWSLGQALKQMPGAPGGLQPTLTALRIQDNDLSKNGAPGLSLVLGNFPQLEILNVSSCKMGDEGALALTEAVGHLVKLKKLSARENNIPLERSQQLFASLSNCPVLQHLDFSQNNIAKRDVRYEFPSHMVSSHGREVVKELLKTLQGSCWWEYLCFFSCGLGGCDFFVETEKMTCLQNLTYLCLQDNAITDLDVQGLVKWFPEMKRLHHLNLRQNHIKMAGASYLAEGIPQLQRLRELLLDHNEFEADGLKKLVDAVKGMEKIERVNLSNCGEMSGSFGNILVGLNPKEEEGVYTLPHGGSLVVE